MDDKDLRKNLQNLQDEIKNTEADDDKGRDLLRELDGDISALLEHSEQHPLHVHPTIIDRLESALEHFEVSQPGLTLLISELLDTMSSSGI